MAMNQQWPSLADLPDDQDDDAGPSPQKSVDGPTATELLLSGLQMARSGRLADAAEIFAQAILKDPESAEAYEALATVLVPMGRLEFASKAKAKAISLGYNTAASWDMLGDMLFGLGQFNDAAEAFRTALQLDPAAPEVLGKLDAACSNAANASQPQSPPANSTRSDEDDLFGPEFLSGDILPPAWARVAIVTIEPEGNPHSAAFEDLALGFECGLRSLGATVERRRNALDSTGVNLLLGAHLIGSQELADQIPGNTVIVNLEQVSGFDVNSRPVYLSLLRRLAVWDYSLRNIDELRRITQNPRVRHFSIGYTREMTRNLTAPEQPVDVLFYGSINARREAILKDLVAVGLNVKHLFSVYGAARDQAIAEAKVVLNMHFYKDSIHEIVRTSFLLANSKAVVTECGARTEIEEDIRGAMVAVPYEELVRSCVALVRDEGQRRALERRAFEIFAKRDQARILRETIATTELAMPG